VTFGRSLQGRKKNFRKSGVAVEFSVLKREDPERKGTSSLVGKGGEKVSQARFSWWGGKKKNFRRGVCRSRDGGKKAEQR